METTNETILAIKDKDGQLVGFYYHDIPKRSVIFYTCEKASMDDIKNVMAKLNEPKI